MSTRANAVAASAGMPVNSVQVLTRPLVAPAAPPGQPITLVSMTYAAVKWPGHRHPTASSL